MGYTTSYWQKERWSPRVADMLTSCGLCWNPSLGTWDVKWRVGVECQRRKRIRYLPRSRFGGRGLFVFNRGPVAQLGAWQGAHKTHASAPKERVRGLAIKEKG